MTQEREKVEEQTTNSNYCTRLLVFTIASSVPMISYGMTCLNPTTPVMQDMYNESWEDRHDEPMSMQRWISLRALTIRIFAIGAFVGSFLLKAFLSCLTKKRCLLAAHYINVIGGAITCTCAGLTRAYEPIIIGRFITGIASGMALGIVPIVVAETSVKNRRQVYNSLIGVCLAIGLLLGMFLGWPKVFGTPQLWPLIPLFPTIPSLIYILLSIPETPYQVMISGDRSDLRMLLRRFRDGSEDALNAEIRDMTGEEEKSQTLLSLDYDELPSIFYRDITLKEAIGVPQYRRQFFMTIILFAGLVFSGWYCIVLYCDVILVEAGFDELSVTGVTMCLMMFQAIATLPGAFLIQRVGSWMLLISGALTMILGQILIVLSVTMTSELSWLAAFGVAVYFFGYSGCTTVAIFPIISEITLEKTRTICFVFGSSTFWLTSWLVGFSSAYFQKWWGANCILIWTALTIGFTIYIMLLVPNTKKLSSPEIQKRFAKN